MENLGIKVDLELDDSKAKSDLDSVIKSLQKLTESKAINIKVDVDDNAIKNLAKIESAVKEINKLSQKAQSALFSSNSTSSLTDYDKARKAQIEKELMYQKMFDKEEQASIKQREQMYKNLFDTISQQEKARVKEETEYIKATEKLYAQSDKEILNGYLTQQKEKSTAFKASMKEESALLKAQEAEYKSFADTLAKSMSKAQKEITQLSKSGFSDASAVKELQASLDKVISSVNWDKVDSLTFDKSIAEIRKLESEIKEAFDIQASNKRNGEITLFSDKVFSDLNRLKSEFKEIGNLESEFDRITNAIKNLGEVAPDRVSLSMKEIRQDVSNLTKDLKELNSTSSRTGAFFDDLWDSMRTFTLGNMIGNALEDGVRAIKDVVVNLDGALTDLMKVAPDNFRGTSEDLKQVGRDAIEVAKVVGQSSEDVILGTAKALQTGAKNMKDAMEIAKGSAMFANVGDISQEQADTYIASVLSAFGGVDKALTPVRENIQGMGKDYNTLTKFIDLCNYSGNKFAISSADVGESLQRSGAVLSEYGVSMEDSVALIVGANESVQDSVKVGTSLKAMAINMAGLKANASDGRSYKLPMYRECA